MSERDDDRQIVPVPAWVWEMVSEVFDLYIDSNNDLVTWISTPDPWDGVQPVPFDITGLSRDESGRVIVKLTDRLGSRVDGSHNARWVEASLACGDWEFSG